MAVIFPRIKSITIYGFERIFSSNEFTINLDNNLSIILGGNGLGKTTLLQSVVYALTGGTDNDQIEEIKALRWNFTYFQGRASDSAYVVIEFYLGRNLITFKRGFLSSRLLECTVLELDGSIRKCTAEQAICEYGNYANTSDFSFLVNRLLYLSESRRSLLWDYDAQIRTLMIINNEFVTEEDYRKLRQKIKEKDSNKRKVHWQIGGLQKLQKRQTNVDQPNNLSDDNRRKNMYVVEKTELLNDLEKHTSRSKQIYSKIKEDEYQLSSLAIEIESIATKIQQFEAACMHALLHEFDNENYLLFGSTIKNGHCPACNQHSEKLKKDILERVSQNVCLLCGEPIVNHQGFNEVDDVDDVDALNSQLKEKIRARNALEVRINQNRNNLKQVDEDIQKIRQDITKLDFDFSDNTQVEDEEDIDEYDPTKLTSLVQLERELDAEINQLTQEADSLYEDFTLNFQTRYDELYSIYSSLASEFLGIAVELRYAKSKAKFVNMNYLVPRFNDIDRDFPETCSEAQRFFLDIAFRMSIIALNEKISSYNSSFICETPENALDVSYVNNVASMFASFMESGGNLILSNNLQLLGIAQVLIREARSRRINVYIFDLLQYGKLSEIQNRSEELFKIRDAIIAETKNDQ